MKKKNLKSLLLNKKAISSLNKNNTNGGAIHISELIGCVSGGDVPDKVSDQCTPALPSRSPMTCFNSCIFCW